MKRFPSLMIILAVFFILSVKPAFAQMGMMGNGNGDTTNLNAATSEILKDQSISNIKNVDCSKVTNDQFEKVGDGWMDYIHGEGQTHEQMDNMMGGEGSDSLKTMHIQMGENYLGCTNINPGLSQNWHGMMEEDRYFSGFNSSAILNNAVLLAALMFLISGSIYFIRRIKK